MARRRDKEQERDVAVRRIDTLLARARGEALARRGDLADRYAQLSLAIARKYQTGLERRHKAQVCRQCGGYLVPGRTSRTRITSGRLVTTCLRCGAVVRRPLRGSPMPPPPLPSLSAPGSPSTSAHPPPAAPSAPRSAP